MNGHLESGFLITRSAGVSKNGLRVDRCSDKVPRMTDERPSGAWRFEITVNGKEQTEHRLSWDPNAPGLTDAQRRQLLDILFGTEGA